MFENMHVRKTQKKSDNVRENNKMKDRGYRTRL